MPQASWWQCCCGLPQYFAHTRNSIQATASQQCNSVLTHNLILIIPALSHRRRGRLSCNIHGGIYSALINTWKCIYLRWFLSFNVGQLVSPVFNQRVRCGMPFCQKSAQAVCTVIWLQQYRASLEVGPVLSFGHTVPWALLQPSNALWRGLEFAH